MLTGVEKKFLRNMFFSAFYGQPSAALSEGLAAKPDDEVRADIEAWRRQRRAYLLSAVEKLNAEIAELSA